MPPSQPPRGTSKADADLGLPVEDYSWEQVSAKLFRPEFLLAAVVLIFIGTRLWLLVAFEPKMADTVYYAQLARHGVDLKLTAYRNFDVEYPPVAWWLIEVPRLLDSKSYLDERPSQEVIIEFIGWYFRWYHAEVLLADTVCLVLSFSIGRRISSTALWVLPGAYALLTIAQPHLLFDRLDIVLTMFFLLCIECWQRSLNDSPGANLWATASYLFLGLGISFKIVPVIFVPYLLLGDLFAVRSPWKIVGRVLALVVAVVGPFLPYIPREGWGLFKIPSEGWGVLKLFQYHSVRGTNLESIWASLMLAAAKFGVPCQVYHAYGGYNLGGSWSDTLKIVSNGGMLGVAALFGLWALLRGRRYDRRLALDTAIVVLVNVTVLSHVYSPQYLNWLMPLAFLLAFSIFPRHWSIWCVFVALVATIVGISSWLFPNHYLNEITELAVLPVELTLARSACLVGFGLLLNVSFFWKYGLIPWRAGTAAPGGVAVAA